MDERKTDEPSDEQLLQRFLAGEEAALGALAGRYESALLGLACGLLGGREDLACDAVQETWLRVIRYGRSFTGRSTLKTWLYRITINQCRTLHKRDGRHLRLAQEASERMSENAFPHDGHQRHEPDPAVRDAVDRLPDAKREIVLLCYHAGLTHQQAAAVLEIPMGTLKSRLNATLNELRRMLSAEVVE